MADNEFEARQERNERIKNAELEFSVILGKTKLEVNEVLDLKIDDIIKLEQKLDQELIACINKKKKLAEFLFC